MKNWTALAVYLRWIWARKAGWRGQLARRRYAVDEEAFSQEVASLSTPYRLAAYTETRLAEEPSSWLDPPLPAVVTWARGRAGAPDMARFAQEVMARHGLDAQLMMVLTPPLGMRKRPPRGGELAADPLLTEALRHPRHWQGHLVCAILDPEAGGWFHFSTWGMFGLYRDWDDIADDISPRWAAYARWDHRLRWQGWRRRAQPVL